MRDRDDLCRAIASLDQSLRMVGHDRETDTMPEEPEEQLTADLEGLDADVIDRLESSDWVKRTVREHLLECESGLPELDVSGRKMSCEACGWSTESMLLMPREEFDNKMSERFEFWDS